MSEVPPKTLGASKTRKRFPWIWIILLLGAITIAVISRFELWLSTPPEDVLRADKGFRMAKETIKPEQLRIWAFDEIQKCAIAKLEVIPNSEIPNYISELFGEPPTEASVGEYHGQKYVSFGWGGPFFDWNIAVGPTNLASPFNSEETTTRWVPGIYFSRYDK